MTETMLLDPLFKSNNGGLNAWTGTQDTAFPFLLIPDVSNPAVKQQNGTRLFARWTGPPPCSQCGNWKQLACASLALALNSGAVTKGGVWGADAWEHWHSPPSHSKHTINGEERSHLELKAAVLSDDCLPSCCFCGCIPWIPELFFVFGRVGWRGKIYSQGMVNKYCSPQQKGHTALHLGGWCVCVQARACVPKWVFKFCCSYSMTFPHRHRQCAELSFFHLQHGGSWKGKEKWPDWESQCSFSVHGG